MRAVSRAALLATSVAAILAATLLPGNAIDPSRMPKPWCLACGDLWLSDVVSNVLLFAPFGVALTWWLPARPWRGIAVAIFGAFFSLGIESLQSIGIPPGRSSALADILANSSGALLGFSIARYAAPMFRAQGLMALRLAWTWTFSTSLLLILTALAIGPRHSVGAPAIAEPQPAISPSSFKHVPGHPWYEAPNDSATVNGFRSKRGWGGPIILTADRESLRWDAAVTVRGFDPLGSRIPLLFVHLPADSAPLFMIAEHGVDAELLVSRRAWDWGLAFPVLRLPGAFSNRAADDPRALRLSATTSTNALRLTAQTIPAATASTDSTVILALVPTLGWAMLQTLVEVDDRIAPLVLFCWLLVLYAPLGWWAQRALASRHRSAWLPAVIGLLIPFALPLALGVASLPATQWGALCLCLALGALGAHLAWRPAQS